MLSLSFTKIEKFKRCAFEYQCYCNRELVKKYHLDTPPLIFGQIMHGIFNDYYKVLDKENRTLEKLIELFRQKYNASKDKHDKIFGTKKVLAKYAQMARKEFENFLGSPLSQQLPYVATEENLKVDLGGVKLIAKIDRLDTSGKGLKIIDYKTGKFIEDKPDPLQLNLYALATFIKFPSIPLHKKTYYYLYDDRFVEVDVQSGEFRQTREFVLKTAEDIGKEKDFKAKKNLKCNWCDFKVICPEY